MTQEASKRIVSKEEYVRQIGNKTSLTFYGLLLLIVSFICLLTIKVFLFLLYGILGTLSGYLIVVSCILSTGPLYVGYLGLRLLQEAGQYPLDVPLSRTNTGDLPAPESLVRASEEPMQAQEAVLLRATIETTEKQEEQLLRATTGEQK